MPNDHDDAIIEPEDTNGSTAADAIPLADTAAARSADTADPNDEIPVPIVMQPAEIDERAQVVEALRGNSSPRTADNEELRR